MKTTGIIAEYNPFHNGHKFHLEKAKEMTGSDYAVVIMSGDYTQRGTPAIYTKYMRARTALLAGADLVLEMPVFGSVASAPDFAACGVNSLHAAGICDFLFFGSESGDIAELKTQAESLENESEEVSAAIRQGLKSGLTWPQARAYAYETVSGNEIVPGSPNDILGIEYIRSLNKLSSSMEPATVRRTDPGYHSEEISGSFASATAARKAIMEQNFNLLSEILPSEFFECLREECCPPVTFDDFSLLLGEKLLNASLEELFSIAGMPDDLARKLYKNKLDFLPAEELVASRKDRQYTYTRINRCLLNLMLNITTADAAAFKSFNSVPWLRILGFRKDAGPLLSALKKNASVPVITKTANAASLLSEPAMELFSKHLRSAELYRLASQLKTGRSIKNEFTRSVIIV